MRRVIWSLMAVIVASLALFLAFVPFSPQVALELPRIGRVVVQMVVPGGEPVAPVPGVDNRSPGETLEDWSGDASALGGAWTANYNNTVDDISSGWNSGLNMVSSLVYGFYFNWFLGLVVIFSLATSIGLIVAWTSKMGKIGLILSIVGVVIYVIALIWAKEDIEQGMVLPYLIWGAAFVPTYALKRTQFTLFGAIGAFVGVVAWVSWYPETFVGWDVHWTDLQFFYIEDAGVGYVSPSTSVVTIAGTALMSSRLDWMYTGAAAPPPELPWLPEIPQTADEWWEFFDYSYTNAALFAAKSTIFLVGTIASIVMIVFALRYYMKDKRGNRNTFMTVVSLVGMVGMWLVLYQSWRLLAQGLIWHLVAALAVLAASVVYSRKVAAHSHPGAKMPRAILSMGAFLAWFTLLSLCVWMTYLPYYVPWRGGWPVTSLF